MAPDSNVLEVIHCSIIPPFNLAPGGGFIPKLMWALYVLLQLMVWYGHFASMYWVWPSLQVVQYRWYE